MFFFFNTYYNFVICYTKVYTLCIGPFFNNLSKRAWAKFLKKKKNVLEIIFEYYFYRSQLKHVVSKSSKRIITGYNYNSNLWCGTTEVANYRMWQLPTKQMNFKLIGRKWPKCTLISIKGCIDMCYSLWQSIKTRKKKKNSNTCKVALTWADVSK